MIVGLGTGSTSSMAIEELGKLVTQGKVNMSSFSKQQGVVVSQLSLAGMKSGHNLWNEAYLTGICVATRCVQLKDVVGVGTSYQSRVLARQFGVKTVSLWNIRLLLPHWICLLKIPCWHQDYGLEFSGTNVCVTGRPERCQPHRYCI